MSLSWPPTLAASETHTVQGGLHDATDREDEKLVLRVVVGRAESRAAQFCEILSVRGFLFLYFFLGGAMPLGLQDLCSPTRNGTWAIGSKSAKSSPLHNQGISNWRISSGSSHQSFWHQGPVLWKTLCWLSQVGRMVSGWFKHIAFMVHFISIIIISAPPQIIKHQTPEVGNSCLKWYIFKVISLLIQINDVLLYKPVYWLGIMNCVCNNYSRISLPAFGHRICHFSTAVLDIYSPGFPLRSLCCECW